MIVAHIIEEIRTNRNEKYMDHRAAYATIVAISIFAGVTRTLQG